MQRRGFLSLIGAAVTAPLLPRSSLAATPTMAAGYSRAQYGLAVFHARTRASLSAADLIGRLNISGAAAEAMMAEMKASGVIAPIANAAAGVMRAVSQTRPANTGGLGDQVMQKAAEMAKEAVLETPADVTVEATLETEIQDAPQTEQEADNGKV